MHCPMMRLQPIKDDRISADGVWVMNEELELKRSRSSWTRVREPDTRLRATEAERSVEFRLRFTMSYFAPLETASKPPVQRGVLAGPARAGP